MARCYSVAMDRDQPLPLLWLVSDERNDARLERALAALPKGSGFVFRHYHLGETARRARFEELRKECAKHGHVLVLSGDADTAINWGADGIYGPAEQLLERPGQLRLATVHTANEIARANPAKVDGMFLSPVFPTRSHPGGNHLGIAMFHHLAAQAQSPVIALGGMNAARAAELGWSRWGAIDGLPA
jgi:thiamine-phosphate pyrophosphorylase